MAKNGRESGRFEKIASLVAGVSTIRSAAESLGISERAAYRTSGSAEFRNRVAEMRSEIAGVAVGKHTAAASQAVDALATLLGPENEPKVRIDASKLILASLAPLAEHYELRGRLEKLERGE